MTATVRSEVWRGPLVAIYPDGRRMTTERTVIITDDWRDTPFGPINFGHTLLMPLTMIEIE